MTVLAYVKVMHCSFQVLADSVANVCDPPEKVPLGNWITVSPLPDIVQLIWLNGMTLAPLVRLAGVETVSVATPRRDQAPM